MRIEDMNSPLGVRGEERLWDYIDGISSPQEKMAIEQLLESDAEWSAKYNELLEVQQLLHSSELEVPSMRFTKNVMEEITKLHIAPATKTYINQKIVWGIGIFFSTVIAGFFVYGLTQIDWTVQSDSKLPVDFDKIDYSKIFSYSFVHVFMTINVILGLFLLDRFLAAKRKNFREQT